MIITVCILILAYTLIGKPVDNLVKKLRNVDWKSLSDRFLNPIKKYGNKAERALLVGAIAYIVIPGDLLPRAVFRWLGILDDLGVAYYVYNKIKNKLTPELESRVQDTLDDWFGPEMAVVIE